MSKATVSRIRHALPVSHEIAEALQGFEAGIIAALRKAKDDGLPQGLLSSIMSAYALQETQKILGGSES
ncbi:hypothetical protein [Pseudomonas sp. UMAB-40]|uniref:hypothetical protein n=1 Tax=Pseudomonas sp. UMAB-40 TaxID=1365407 RepID=UPI001C598C0A|nr:hypothetical protein [Pseudomonas sp. UMAB-40]